MEASASYRQKSHPYQIHPYVTPPLFYIIGTYIITIPFSSSSSLLPLLLFFIFWVQALLDVGADPRAKDHKGKPPLARAKEAPENRVRRRLRSLAMRHEERGDRRAVAEDREGGKG